MEGGLEFRQRFERGVPPRAFVRVEDELPGLRLVLAVHADFDDFEGNDFLLEPALGDSRERALVAAKRELVLLFARDLVFSSQVFRRQSHAEVSVRIVLHQVGVRREVEPAHRNQTHAFRSARDDDLRRPRHDALGGEGDGLQA